MTSRPTTPTPGRADLLTRFLLMLVLLSSNGLAAPPEASRQSSIEHSERSQSDRERDARSRPAAVLALSGMESGDTVLDLFGGGGYYSELASRIVGPEGRVYLHNNDAYVSFVGPALDARLLDGRLPNVVRVDAEVPTFDLPARSVDVALMIMSWHDLYWVDEAWPAVDVPSLVARIRATLAPDGRLVIVDHAARHGRGIDDVDALHRIEEAHVIETLRGFGFELAGRADALRNADDPRTVSVFDAIIRGATDRFALAFVRMDPDD